ncbi:hypothetical protein VULLAG_LOCUS10558 [Vulpes lagopus]
MPTVLQAPSNWSLGQGSQLLEQSPLGQSIPASQEHDPVQNCKSAAALAPGGPLKSPLKARGPPLKQVESDRPSGSSASRAHAPARGSPERP